MTLHRLFSAGSKPVRFCRGSPARPTVSRPRHPRALSGCPLRPGSPGRSRVGSCGSSGYSRVTGRLVMPRGAIPVSEDAQGGYGRSIAAIRAVPGSGSYPEALRVRLPPSRPLPRGRDAGVYKGSRPLAFTARAVLPTLPQVGTVVCPWVAAQYRCPLHSVTAISPR